MSFVTILILVYLMVLKEGILTDTTDIWPSGEYGLPKAISGCPAKFSGVSWEEGWIQQDLEDDDASHDKTNSSSSFHMDANFTNEYLRRTFCMKIGYTNLKLWPNGTYCIYKKNTCPMNMKTGFIKWDDEDDDNDNKYNGTSLPDGNYDTETLINYCCEDGGYWFNSIELPVDNPFYLLPHKSPHCQRVKWALSSLEFIVYDTENENNNDKFSGSHVFAEEVESLPKIYYCYYEGCRHKLDGVSGSFSSLRNVPDIYPNFQYCSWLITVNRTLLVSLNFTSIHVPNCQENYIEIYDGENETFPLLARYCGLNATEGNKVESTGNNVYMVLKSGNNSLIPGMHPKFNANYTTHRFPARVISINGGGVHIVENNVILNCIVEGDPVPSVTWKKVDIRNHSTTVYRRFVLENNNRTIVLNKTTTNDSGVYVCVAENRYGKDEKNTSITIAVPAQVISINGGGVHLVENNVILNCIVEGDPVPSITWKKVNVHNHSASVYTRFVFKNYYRTIVLKNTTINDTGVYVCVAENRYGKDEKNTSITIAAFPDLTTTSILEYVRVGQDFNITCSWQKEIDLLKIDNLEWIKNGRSIDLSPSSRYTKIAFDRLLVTNSTVKQSGRYQCEGNIGLVSKLSSFVDITVFVPSGPVVFEREPETTTTGIRLFWKPIEKSFWNGQEITYVISVMKNHIRVKVYKATDSKAIIAGLQPSTTYIIVLYGKTTLGETPRTAKIATTKPNKNNKQYELNVKLTDVDFSKSLEDHISGRYKELKTSLEKSINTIYEESSIRLQFMESKITGFRKGSVIAEVAISLYTTFSQNPLIVVERLNDARTIAGHTFDKSFTEVKDFDECKDESFNSCHEYASCTNIDGSYICKCFEGFFGDGEKCQGPAQIIAKSAWNVTQSVETNVTLVCTVIGDPNPVITWLRRRENGDVHQIKSTTNKYNSNLTIVLATIEHSGVYVCNASNILGHQSYETRLTIKPVVVNINVEIKLSHKKFEEELKNQSSSKYKKLEENVYVELFNFFNNTPGFDDIEILGFANGSVKVLFRIILKVKKPSTDTRNVVILRFGKKLNNQLNTGRLGNFWVVPEPFKLAGPPLPPVNVTYTDVKVTEMHIYWDPPELYESFSIHTYYVRYRKYGEFWINESKRADLPTNAPLRNLESNSFYSVQIIAENADGVSDKSHTIEVKTMEKKVISPWYYIIPIICVLIIALIGLVYFLFRRFGLSRNYHFHETKKNKQHRKESGLSFQLAIRGERSDNVHENKEFTQTDAKKCWDEIPRTSIALTEKLLVPGQFGVIVVEGKVMKPLLDIVEPCSVKLFKDYTAGQSTHDLMEEIHNISAVGSHKNIVNLIGACTDLDGSPLLVLELCDNGTLENYLKMNRKIDDEKRVVSRTIKMEWANEIAKGMNHLAAVKIVHRDLAARNVFLTEDLTAKISNFGLSRNISEQGSYEKLSGGKLPARWMALESLTDGSYSMKSDVWSFGILLWEIETGASMPYQEFEITKLVEQLRRGYRLPKPGKCPDKIYDLMLQCWKVNPLDRPNFNKIADIVENVRN